MILLGSSSETRAKILKERNIAFKQVSCDFDEEALDHKIPSHFVYHAAMGKMKACVEKYGIATPLLCADTVVTAHGKILRKAKDMDDARRILLMQSGFETSILTCMVYRSISKTFIDLSATVYTFLPFDKNDMESYLQNGQWMGKAGACMVEGFCKPYISHVKGLESCAMGLTIEKLEPFLNV